MGAMWSILDVRDDFIIGRNARDTASNCQLGSGGFGREVWRGAVPVGQGGKFCDLILLLALGS